MRTFTFFLLIFCVALVVKSFAGQMTVTTGQGYYTENGQAIAYYNLAPGSYSIDDNLSYVETKGTPTVALNYTAKCNYYQAKNPSLNMHCDTIVSNGQVK